MACAHIFKSNCLCYLAGNTNLLANAINKVELHLGEHDCKGNTGETATAAHVHYLCTGFECDVLRNRK